MCIDEKETVEESMHKSFDGHHNVSRHDRLAP